MSSKLVRGSQPSCERALEGSPIRCSTSAGPQEAGVEAHVLVGIQAHVLEGDLHQPANAVGLARRDHVVLGLVALEHQPHGLDVVLRVAPVALGVEVAEGELLGQPELDGGGAVGDLAGDELQPAALRVVHNDAAHARAEVAALGLQVEDELRVLHRLADAHDLRRVLAEVRALGAHLDRRQVELVVGAAGTLLHVHRRRLVEPVVHPAQSLGENGAVGLDRHALAALEAVAGVVAVEERLPDLGVGVEHERGDLLVGRGRVELLAEPGAGADGPVEVQLADHRVGIEARPPVPLVTRSQKESRPQLSLPGADLGIVVREARCLRGLARPSRRPPSARGTRPSPR